MSYLHQIDFIKGFAILSVIVLHSVPLDILTKTYCVFHIWQAVPIFIILMGFNLIRNTPPLYSKVYFYKKYKRIVEPFLIVCFISLSFGFLFYRNDLYVGWMNLIGLMPKTGAGNYYITILLQFILLAPVLYELFKRNPKLSVICFCLFDVIFQLLSMKFEVTGYIYSGSIFRFFSALAIGMWLAEDYSLKSKRNLWIVVGFLVSSIYLYISNTFGTFYFNDAWKFQNIISFFYPAFLITLCLNYLPDKFENYLLKGICKIGKASYHIFLTQMIFFALIPSNSIAKVLSQTFNYYIIGSCLIIFNVFSCVLIGILFYKFDTNIKNKVPQ